MITRKLRTPRPSFRTEESNSTYRLPLKSDARISGVAAYQLGLTVDGHEVLKQIRDNERTRLLPIVILTTSVEDKDRLEGYRLGANSYVRKPVDFAEFARAIIQLGLYWLVLNERPPPVSV